MKCSEIYETGLLYHHYANTAYPLTPRSFMQYKITDENEIKSFLAEQWKKVDELCLYAHIPFCKSRCKFCEYTVLENTDDDIESEYTELLIKEMKMYSELLRGKKIAGFDLGGGTPTKLSAENLTRITKAVKELFNIEDGVVFSVETTPVIAANEPEKIKLLYDLGYRRISMGIQTVSEKLLNELGREGSTSVYEKAVKNIREAGFERFNIDLMYGFLHQTDVDFRNTLKYAIGLAPDYITLYRNRYKGTKLEFEAGGVSVYKAMYQYRIAYSELTEAGYDANIGKNTFSRIDGDYGTSDYLTKRVIEGMPYVGMGLGAQSFGMDYLAYNLGAAEKRMERYRNAVNADKFPIQDIYRLPIEESIAKMVSVAFYFAFVDLECFKKRFGMDFTEVFSEEVKFVIENGFMEIKGDRIYLTERGSDHINGVIPLFYSESSKEELKKVFSDRHFSEKTDEEIFLSAYNINNYDRPSVAADIAAFAIRTNDEDNYRKDSSAKLSLLLIKRGEHPFMNKWALPGGFLRPDETIEECALREITEETNVTPSAILPVGVFSKPNRDPRGRIISNAFASIITEENVKAMGGDDAIDAKWFDVSFECEDGAYILTLTNGDTVLTARLYEKDRKFGEVRYEIDQSGDLAFDHAAIIAAALTKLRSSIGDFDIIFDFLPEKFTLASLQQVMETVAGISVLPANFRRKVSGYVEETNDYIAGAGHRPAQLFKRKM
ncbi:MAG: radical SAM protein [Oscillospiraceae bacterium]